MPAVTFMHSTTQSSQNCGVRIAAFDVDVRCGHDAACGGPRRVQPAGLHPGAARER